MLSLLKVSSDRDESLKMLQQYLSDCEENYGYDSECSETTVNSEDAEKNVNNFNVVQSIDDPPNFNRVINLHVESVNIYGENEGEKVEIF